MTTHETLAEARAYAESKGLKSGMILEFVMDDGRTAYGAAKVGISQMRRAIQRSGKGLPGVAELVAEHHLDPNKARRDELKAIFAVAKDEFHAAGDRGDYEARREAESRMWAAQEELKSL